MGAADHGDGEGLAPGQGVVECTGLQNGVKVEPGKVVDIDWDGWGGRIGARAEDKPWGDDGCGCVVVACAMAADLDRPLGW